MFVNDYLRLAVHGEIAPLSLSNIGSDGGTDEEQKRNLDKLIDYLNQANLEIHKRFQLLQYEHLLCNVAPDCVFDLPVDFLYPLHAMLYNGLEVSFNNDRRMWHGHAPYDPYRQDGTIRTVPYERYNGGRDYWVSLLFFEPFKVIVKGNWPNRPMVDIRAPREIKIEQIRQNAISMVYVAAPEKVCSPEQFIDLPEQYTEAIINYMTYKAYAAMASSANSSDNAYYGRFLASVQAIDREGLFPTDNLDTNIKLNCRGFV